MKTYILDTNIILEVPNILNLLSDCKVVIPLVVLEELDSFKNNGDELAINARSFSRKIDDLHDLDYYIKENNVKVEFDYPEENDVINRFGYSNDNIIIQSAYNINHKFGNVELLSNDTNVRLKARSMGIKASEFTSDSIINKDDSIYKGHKHVYVDGNLIDILYRDEFIPLSYIKNVKTYPNMFFELRNGTSQSALAKVDPTNLIAELVKPKASVFGVKPKNIEQRMLIELLTDENIPLVVGVGMAGTGKTLLSIASALHLVKDKGRYDKIILSKPTIASGEDIGFLPGDMEEKLAPWLQSYKDNLEFLLGEENSEDYEMLNIEITALTYMRGRSIPNQFIIIDEVQNLTKKEIKTILTRVGEGSKIVLLGDIKQIDNKKLDEINNGLSYVINKFKGQSLFGCVNLSKGVRSPLATLAAELL